MESLVLFGCEQRLDSDLRSLERAAAAGGYALRLVTLPCSSSLEPAIVLRAFEGGADAVGVLACRPEFCRQGDGSRRAERRMARAARMLEDIGLGAGRILFQKGEPGQGTGEALTSLLEAARAAGPSPLRKGP
ncbi:MAG: hydrogenase iron-sulfur subunit [Chloroflexi bacterium]|nr:hydrogenase iron-sulfur subunit [Chloroflexota bacterium]